MEAPAAAAVTAGGGVHRELEEAVVRLRSDRQQLDALLDAYGDHLGQMTSRADHALAVVARRCGTERWAR